MSAVSNLKSQIPPPRPSASSAVITPAQRKALFAWARERGKTIDDLRDMTPAGSISMLTRVQAAELLERLNQGTSHERDYRGPPPDRRKPRRAYGSIHRMVSTAQSDLIVAIRMDLGWSEDHLVTWLSQRHYRSDPTRPMSEIHSSRDAAEVIELLKAVRSRSAKTRERSADTSKRRNVETEPLAPAPF